MEDIVTKKIGKLPFSESIQFQQVASHAVAIRGKIKIE